MRWLALYARSRHVPAAVGALLAATVLVWWRAHQVEPGHILPAVALLTAGVAVLSIGLGSPDVALDRTAAIRWLVRRIGLIALIAVAVVVAVQVSSGSSVPLAVVARDAIGMCGLAAVGAAAFGGPFAWALPLGWLAVAVVVPQYPDVPTQIVTWMLRPADAPAAAWTALVLGVAGTAIYAAFGPRR